MSSSSSSLTPDQLAQIRDELDRALARIERSLRLSDEAASPVTLDQSTVGRLSRIDSLQNQSLVQGLRDRERAQLNAILDALRRMDEGSYGTCDACESPIQFERLLVFPETRNCSPCAGVG